MTPRIHMPILRQLARDPDAPLLGRLRQFRAPVVYELVHDYMIHVSGYGHLWLPAGFRSDLASTPRPTWLCGGRPDGLFLIPGLYHDWYYRHGGVEERVSMQSERGRWTVTLGDGTRAWGDRLFRDLALEVGGLRVPAYAAWAALRLCGGIAWRQNAKYRRAWAESGQREWQLHGDYDNASDTT